jgi:hypothetical protein
MSDRILDYNYARNHSAKTELEYVLTHPPAKTSSKDIIVETHVMGLDGKTYIKYATVSLNELAKRSYLIHWGSQHPSILYTDVAYLPNDIRVYKSVHNTLPIHRLTAMEQAMMKRNFKMYLAQSLSHWGKVDTVKSKG